VSAPPKPSIVWNAFAGSIITAGTCSSGCASGWKAAGAFSASRSPVSRAVRKTRTLAGSAALAAADGISRTAAAAARRR
jgi:hypothetical protein